MSTPLVNTCQVCGAEEGLDSLLLRMIDDDTTRRLIHDVLVKSLPLGGLVVRYLRLHKPPKQKLRMGTVGKLLAELVPDIRRDAIERKGRIWAVSADGWKAAFQVVFDAAESGRLDLPLDGNGYLYGVVLRMADRAEGQAEREQEATARGRVHQGGAKTLNQVLDMAQGLAADMQAFNAEHGVAPAPGPRVAPPPASPRQDSPTVKRMKAEIARRAGEAQS